MKSQRKTELMYCFPKIPDDIFELMQGRGAANFCVFLSNGQELFVRCFHRYTRGRLIERQRYVFAKDGAVRYLFDEYGASEQWRIATKFTEPRFAAPGYMQYFDNTYAILNANAYKNSDLKYCRLHDMKCLHSPMYFLRLFVRHPNIEYLIKSGYGHLIEEKYKEYYYYATEIRISVNHRVNLKSNNLLKMLGLNREEFRLLRGREQLYSDYIDCREDFPRCRPEQLFEFIRTYSNRLVHLKRQTELTGLSPGRIVSYVKGNDIEISDYTDYLLQCVELEYNLSDTAVSMPKSFYRVHERLSELIKLKADAATRRAFAKNYEKRRLLEFEQGELFLRQPGSMEEIVFEGKTLSHCVGGYAERHAKGITNIFFIRQKSNPDKPYYTIEVDNSLNIVQCRGYRNNSAGNPKPDEIKQFESNYAKYLQEVLRNGKGNNARVQQSA